MSDVKTILSINPGSTSTKIAVYEGAREVFKSNVEHPAEELAKYPTAASQYDMRKQALLDALEKAGVSVDRLDAIAARGGSLPPVKGGAYLVNTRMIDRLMNRPTSEHACNVAAVIGFELGEGLGIPAYIYDAICTDELTDIAKVTGNPAVPRLCLFHALNSRAQARRAAEKIGIAYGKANIIVAHLGGGITISLHSQGQVVDIVSDDEGPFSPERAGRLHCRSLIELCYSGEYSHLTMRKMQRGQGGLVALLGTNSAIEVERRIAAGDAKAELVYRAMAYQIAKGVGDLATVVAGKVDAIVLTGGVAYSTLLTGWIAERIQFIAPVEVLPGENELESLALGVLRVLNGEEVAHDYDLP
ncbi:MAG TPA: butyrate kinase [Telmatospirillum sp.]|nr:butyrate kinase [Telmatospirillum sp.]